MRRCLQPVLGLALALTAGAFAGEVVDRVVATVDHHALLQSELDDTLRYQALLDGRTPASYDGRERAQALHRLLDELLIEEEIGRSNLIRASREDIEPQVRELRRQISGAQTDEGWQRLLQGYGLTQQDVDARVAEQIDILRFVDVRFRSGIQIDPRSIQQYYVEQFLPKLHRAGAPEAPLREVSDKIEEILVQQRITDLMDDWLKTLRAQREVKIR